MGRNRLGSALSELVNKAGWLVAILVWLIRLMSAVSPRTIFFSVKSGE
ncbi:MAG: hypothetical protein WC600_17335 [Desulfobaccales bacterium]